MRARSDRIFLSLLIATAAPAVTILFALARGAHEARKALAKAPAPVGEFCQIAVTYSVNPIAHIAYVAVGSVAILSLGIGIIAVVSLHRRTSRRLRSTLIEDATCSPRVARIAAVAGVSRLRILTTAEPQAFTFGYLRPAVAISLGLLARLDDAELEAVLRHEAEHVRRRDPFRMLIVAGITRALFIAPVVGRIGDAFQVAKEIDADLAVLRGMGSRRPLVSALLSAGSPDNADAAPGFAGTLDARISWLEGEDPLSRGSHGLVSWLGTAASVSAIAVGLFVIVTGSLDAHVLHVCIDG